MNPLQQLSTPLLLWYQKQARNLPWRTSPTPYHVWISEIMLQQTRVAAVLGYYQRFLSAVPTIETLAQLPEDELMKLWQGLGYYNRARNMQKAAQILVSEYGGVFPNSYDEIHKLPGIGDYTAGAICSIAFHLPTPAVDGNVLRVVARITGDEEDISTIAMKKKVTNALQTIIPLDNPGDFNQAMMELGATVCLPNGAPLCDECPAFSFCIARQKNLTHKLPVKAPKKPRKIEHRQVYLLFWNGHVAIRQRPKKGLLAGLWEYPNELDTQPDLNTLQPHWQKAGTGKHIFTHIEWHMSAFWADTISPDLPSGWVWADLETLAHSYAIPNAFQDFQSFITSHLLSMEVHPL